MTGVAHARRILIATLAAACFGCSGGTATQAASDTTGSTETDLDATLTIPIGDYTGCMTAGGNGTVRLSAAGDGALSADLSFDRWLTGTMEFAATSSATAGLSAGPFEVQMFDPTAIIGPTAPGGSTSTVSASVAAGTLVLAGDTLFISLYAHNNDTEISGYSVCPVPTSLPSTTIVNSAPPTADIPSGEYTGCTTSFGPEMESSTSGGDFTLTLAKSNGRLTATESDGFPSICNLAFDYESGSTAMLSDGQTCLVSEPCGPPPLLGTSSAPDEAVLTHMTGAMGIAGGTLFINVVGDAPVGACGSHVLSLICPQTP